MIYQKKRIHAGELRLPAIIEKTNHWIFKIAQSIRAIDVVMNDGIQKMAEATGQTI